MTLRQIYRLSVIYEYVGFGLCILCVAGLLVIPFNVLTLVTIVAACSYLFGSCLIESAVWRILRKDNP